MKGTTTSQTPDSFQNQSLLCIEVKKASEVGNIDTKNAFLVDRGLPSKMTLRSLNSYRKNNNKKPEYTLKKLNKLIFV